MLLAVVKEVKKTMEENGVDDLFNVSPKKKKKNTMVEKSTEKNVVIVPRKKPTRKQKFSTVELLLEPFDRMEDENDQANPETDPHIRHHKRVLYMKALSCLKNHNYEMYEEVRSSNLLLFKLFMQCFVNRRSFNSSKKHYLKIR